MSNPRGVLFYYLKWPSVYVIVCYCILLYVIGENVTQETHDDSHCLASRINSKSMYVIP